ncbi:MAG: hypothetical protein RR998_08020 [Oscillospiraceae bacterium]
MYYRDGISQNDISREDGVSRSRVSRLPDKARECGIAKIYVQKPEKPNADRLQDNLKAVLGLREVHVLPVDVSQYADTSRHCASKVRPRWRIPSFQKYCPGVPLWALAGAGLCIICPYVRAEKRRAIVKCLFRCSMALDQITDICSHLSLQTIFRRGSGSTLNIGVNKKGSTMLQNFAD